MKVIGAWARRLALLGVLAAALAACGGPTAEANTANLVLQLVEGRAFWQTGNRSESIALPPSAEVVWDDQVWTTPDAGAVVALPDDSRLRLGPDTRIVLRRPRVGDSRPVIRLIDGQIHILAQSDSFLVESYREIPQALRIIQLNMVLDPRGTPGEFELRFDGNIVKAMVAHGVVDVRAAGVSGTLLAEWQAVLTPDEPLLIIPPFTPTPTPSRTPSASPTPTTTLTITATATATPSATRAVIQPTAAASPTPTTVVPPTATNPPPGNGGGPKPPPPPTATNPPPPTNTPEPPTATSPPPSDTPKPTPPAIPPPTTGP